MKKFEITIKERGNDHLLTPSYSGDDSLTREDMIEFFGLDGDDVEWYKIEEV